eukprot:SAG31_NODE_33863_length_339_cov_0.854167_1_plen_78_part_01
MLIHHINHIYTVELRCPPTQARVAEHILARTRSQYQRVRADIALVEETLAACRDEEERFRRQYFDARRGTQLSIERRH